jgi:hypothetical protein
VSGPLAHRFAMMFIFPCAIVAFRQATAAQPMGY